MTDASVRPGGDAPPAGTGFYAGVPAFEGFARLMDPALYRPLPDDWWLGLGDVVSSTAAIGAGRYKSVNTAGASMIAAVGNALGGRAYPFVFGGDGASFAVPPEDAPRAREALAATAAWVRDDLDLELRVAMVPVAAARAAGLDVRVARFSPSRDVSYAMFTGGGLAWAEARMKQGAYPVEPGPPGARPVLDGLSCRFEEIPAARGVILSLLLAAGERADPEAFRALVEEVLALAAEAARPVPEGGPALRWPARGFDIEARLSRRPGEPLFLRRLRVGAYTLLAYAIMRSGLRVGRFDPARYRREVVENTDFRKYDDGLRMTLDCAPELADRIEARLGAAQAAGLARFGLHRQGTALMTCITPSAARSDHIHFIDGADGGYALAARRLKGQAPAGAG